MGEDKSGFDEDMGDGHEPQEESGPGPGASPGETEMELGSQEGGVDLSHARFSDELDDSVQLRRDVWITNPADGLPSPVDEVGIDAAIAPALTEENLVCMEDTRMWVDSEGRVYPEEKVRFHTYLDSSNYDPPREVGAGHKADTPDGPVVVRPVRVHCQHYHRMITRSEDNPDIQIIYRHCTVRRSVGGAFMSLRDTTVLACTLRSPRDHLSEKKFIDDPERERLRSKRHLVMVPLPLAGAKR